LLFKPTYFRITPTNFQLTNTPNPFNPTAKIISKLLYILFTNIVILNKTEQKVVTLINKTEMGEGEHTIEWNGKNKFGIPLSSGIYFYRITANPFENHESYTLTKKMNLLK